MKKKDWLFAIVQGICIAFVIATIIILLVFGTFMLIEIGVPAYWAGMILGILVGGALVVVVSSV